MIKGVTKTGFKYTIDENKLKSYKLIKLLSSIENDPLKVPELVNYVLGDKQEKDLISYLENKSEATIDNVANEISDIFQNKKLKNS